MPELIKKIKQLPVGYKVFVDFKGVYNIKKNRKSVIARELNSDDLFELLCRMLP